jgi:hypothetical protein
MYGADAVLPTAFGATEVVGTPSSEMTSESMRAVSHVINTTETITADQLDPRSYHEYISEHCKYAKANNVSESWLRGISRQKLYVYLLDRIHERTALDMVLRLPQQIIEFRDLLHCIASTCAGYILEGIAAECRTRRMPSNRIVLNAHLCREYMGTTSNTQLHMTIEDDDPLRPKYTEYRIFYRLGGYYFYAGTTSEVNDDTHIDTPVPRFLPSGTLLNPEVTEASLLSACNAVISSVVYYMRSESANGPYFGRDHVWAAMCALELEISKLTAAPYAYYIQLNNVYDALSGSLVMDMFRRSIEHHERTRTTGGHGRIRDYYIKNDLHKNVMGGGRPMKGTFSRYLVK